MKKILFLFLFLLLTSYTHAILIWLKDGSVIQCEIIDTKGEMVIVKRLDNGGTLEIPFRAIQEKCRYQILKKLGLVSDPKVLLKIPGVRIYLKTGGIVVGRFLKKKGRYIMIRNRSGVVPVPRSNILKKEKFEVPINKIYRAEELYKEVSSNYDLKNANDNYKLAKFLLKLKEYEKAKFHFEKAKELRPALAQRIDPVLNKINALAKEFEKKNAIRRFHMYKNGNRYGKAKEQLEKIQNMISEKQYADYKEELLAQEKKYYVKIIAIKWIRRAEVLIRKQCTSRKVTLEDAKKYVLGAMDNEILEYLAKKYSLHEDEVKLYLEKRELDPPRRYSYRDGTFIAGIRGKTPRPRVYIRRSSQITPETWWKAANSSTKKQWLCAYYFENTFTLEKHKLKECHHCGGKGVLLKRAGNILCPLCQGSQYFRTVFIK